MALVNVTEGMLRGGRGTTESGFEYYEFLGVPYAKPPLGELRFKSPQEPEQWEGMLDVSVIRTDITASQFSFKLGKPSGNEDCLYLNIYTPRIAYSDSNSFPVIVYIHGGGFVLGNGIDKRENGPDFLLESGTIVVTINYRLGVFGFLSLGIPEAAGNMGLKDQVQALKWIQKNISCFGGDCANVTIVGLSAGAVSIEYLILSPSAKGLFHKAILRSGSSLNHWAINFEPLTLARLVAHTLKYGGSFDCIKSLYKFFLKEPTEHLVRASYLAAGKMATRNLFTGFVPVIEKDFGNGEAFLTVSPWKLLLEGKFNRVPVIKGFCNYEGVLMYVSNPIPMKKLREKKNFIDHWPYDVDASGKAEYNTKFLNEYNNPDGIEAAVTDFFGDLDFVSGIWLSAKMMARRGVPVYMYQFTYDGKLNYLKKTFGLLNKGACHTDDQAYLLRNMNICRDATEHDIIVQKRIIKLYTDFAKYGKPTSTSTSDLIPVSWPLFTEELPVYLVIDKDLSHKHDYKPSKMAIFEALYKKYYK